MAVRARRPEGTRDARVKVRMLCGSKADPFPSLDVCFVVYEKRGEVLVLL